MGIIDLDDPLALAAGDPSGMLDVLKDFPSQCRQAVASADHLASISAERYRQVLVCGMGGSAIAGDLLSVFLRLPTKVHRDYGLPPWIDKQALLIAISCSGNTEETLSAVQAGLKQGFQPICIFSGGLLRELARQHELPQIEIPAGLQPRAALAYLALPLLALAARNGLTRGQMEFERVLTELRQLTAQISSDVPVSHNPAKRLAKAIYGRVPLIYGISGAGELVARRWKTQLNENAKQPAFYGAIPELCHNEIVSLAPLRDLLPESIVLLLRDADERPENRKRVEILKEMLTDYSVPFEEVRPQGESHLSRLLAQIHLGDYVSVYLALLNEVDPTPVEPIERFKMRLKP